jgi:hypothetical protein
MCGDDEDDPGFLAERLLDQFVAHARAGRASPGAAQVSDARQTYMDGLFGEALGRCLEDAQARRGSVLGDQSLVFARLCGFLAGHVALGQDPLRRVIEALMAGYDEAEESLESEQNGRHVHGGGANHEH